MQITLELIERVRKNDPSLINLSLLHLSDEDQGLFIELLQALKTNTKIKGLKAINRIKNPGFVAVLEELLQINNAIKNLDIKNFPDQEQEAYQRIQQKVATNKSFKTDLSDNDNDPQAEWRCFLSRSQVLKNAWGCDQEQWAKLCLANVNAAVDYLRANINSPELTAKSFYAFLANRRHEMAEQLEQYRCGALGIFRRGEGDPPRHKYDNCHEAFAPETPLSKRPPYGEFYDYFYKKLLALTNTSRWLPFSTFPKASFTVQCDGIELTTLTFKCTYELDAMGIKHPPVARVKQVFEKVEPYFQAVIRSNATLRDKLKNIARMVWWFAQVMPLERGSAATTEKDMRALMKFLGFPLVPYENDVPLDLEAIFEPDIEVFVEKFLSWFPGLFENHIKQELVTYLNEFTKNLDQHNVANWESQIDKQLANSYMQVIAAFKEEAQEYQAELQNILAHSKDGKQELLMIKLNKKFDKLKDKYEKFKRLFDLLFDKKDAGVCLKPSEQVNREDVLQEARQLIEDIAGNRWNRIGTAVVNFFVKAITALGIPITLTTGGAYVGAFVGGLLGLPSVFIAGPFGIALTANLGALIGGGIGAVTGTGAGIYATRKISFFQPLNTRMQCFAECATGFAKTMQCNV